MTDMSEILELLESCDELIEEDGEIRGVQTGPDLPLPESHPRPIDDAANDEWFNRGVGQGVPYDRRDPDTIERGRREPRGHATPVLQVTTPNEVDERRFGRPKRIDQYAAANYIWKNETGFIEIPFMMHNLGQYLFRLRWGPTGVVSYLVKGE